MAAPESDKAGVRQVVRALRKAGWVVTSVWDGEEDIDFAASATETSILEALMATDQSTLVVEHRDTETDPALVTRGWVSFVYGNDPEEVVCDHTVNLSPVLDPLTRSWWS